MSTQCLGPCTSTRSVTTRIWRASWHAAVRTKSKLDLGLEMTSDVEHRVLKYVDENLPDTHAVGAKVKDLIDSCEVEAKVKASIGSGKEFLGSGSAKASGLLGRFIKHK